MPKYLLTGDLHLFPHKKSSERLEDCLKVLDWIFETAKEKKVDGVIVLGDLFHDRQRIDIPVYHKTFEIFRKHLEKNSLSVYLLLGNHDLWYQTRWDVSSVFPLEAIKNVTVVDHPCTMEACGFPISFLPYTDNPIVTLAAINNKSPIKILCGHIAIDGAVMNVMHGVHSEVSVEHDGSMIKIGGDVFSGWDFVFLGHYHAAQKVSNNIEYVGSPLQLSFGEAFQHKHVIIFDTDTLQKEYVRNTFSPQHFIIPEKDLDKYELKNNFIKIVVDNISSSNIVDLRKKLVEEHEIGSFEILQNTGPQEQKQIIEDVKTIIQDQSKMVEEYVKQTKIDSLEEAKLMNIWNKIIELSENKETIKE